MRRFLTYLLIVALTLTPLVFSVDQVFAAGITLNTTSSFPGNAVTVTGTAFAANETGIVVLFDNSVITSAVKANSAGGWTVSFVVPEGASGVDHEIDARGDTTSSSSVTDVVFNITPTTTLNPTSGTVGTSTTVTAMGFTASETDMKVSFDGTLVELTLSSPSATSKGSWSGTFTIPAAATGNHIVDASGAKTTAINVPDRYFMVSPAIALGKITGPPGTSVGVTGTGFSANETGINVTYDGIQVGTAVTANAKGSWSSSFNVPNSPAGPHIVDAFGASTLATSIPDVNFTSGSGISLTAESGTPGSSVTIQGSGFTIDETGIVITFDGVQVASNIKASATGGFTKAFIVPELPGGTHIIDAYGSVTQTSVITDISFIVSPGILVNPPGGPPGKTVTVTGSGFATGESNITLTFDGAIVAYAIVANAKGTWTATFVVPSASGGVHVVDADGPISKAASVADANFTSGAGISINKQSGAPGISISVNGFGFTVNEKGINVKYDGNSVASNITADAQGAWTSTFIIPNSLPGTHKVTALGSNTMETTISPVTFTISAGISVNPESGSIGQKVTISGFGFTPNISFKIRYDDQDLNGNGTKTDSSGGLKQTVTIPKSTAGSHVITIIDQENNESKAYFDVENVPPPSPRLLSPTDGNSAGLLSGSQVIFRWREVTDPSDVYYIIQINNNPEFTNPFIEKSDLGTSFTPSSTESLSNKVYYWRVKAVDGAGNESEWSEMWAVKTGSISLWALIMIILTALIIIAGLLYYFLVYRPKAKLIEVPVQEEFEVIGQWWPSESQIAAKPKGIALPRRLALPQPAKSPRTLSLEQQARMKVIANFAQSLPLAKPNYTADWLLDVVGTNPDLPDSPAIQKQILDGSLFVRYDPAWKHHPLYYEMTELLKDQPILQSLNGYVEMINQCASETGLLMHDIYRDTIAEIPPDVLGTNDWEFVTTVYSDCMSWILGKSLQEPSDRDYMIKSNSANGDGADVLWLWGAESSSFAVPLISTFDEEKIKQYRNVHLKLRRMYRTNPRTKQIVGMITQSEVQHSRLLNSFNQFASVMQ